jgi:hypothetical protein
MTTTWPPRRLPSRTRLYRIRFLRMRSEILTPLAWRLTLWTSWVAMTGLAFLVLDLYT